SSLQEHSSHSTRTSTPSCPHFRTLSTGALSPIEADGPRPSGLGREPALISHHTHSLALSVTSKDQKQPLAFPSALSLFAAMGGGNQWRGPGEARTPG